MHGHIRKGFIALYRVNMLPNERSASSVVLMCTAHIVAAISECIVALRLVETHLESHLCGEGAMRKAPIR